MNKLQKQNLTELYRILFKTNTINPKIHSMAILFTMSALSVVTTAMLFSNIVHQYNQLVFSSSLLLFFELLCILVCCVLKKLKLGLNITAFGISAVFTYFSFFVEGAGASQGFSILWFLFIPIISMSIASYQTGFYMSLYMQFLLIFFCYTPRFYHVIEPYYTVTFIKRFPFLYLAFFTVTIIAAGEIKYLLHRQNNYQQELKTAVNEEHDRVLKTWLETIISINKVMMARDSYTAMHSERVAKYCCILAQKLGWNKNKIENLRNIALLHDIGKIGISERILYKEEALTKEEYDIIKTHTTIGADILKDLTLVPNIELGAKYHHEHFDGTGYPEGLKGLEIPIEARIICIADAYDAMHTKRTYKNKYTKDYIRQQIVEQSGKQFDPELVPLFLEMMDLNLI